MEKDKKPSSEKRKVDNEFLEEQLRYIMESSELSELDQVELPEEIRSKLEKADITQLESIERELGLNEFMSQGENLSSMKDVRSTVTSEIPKEIAPTGKKKPSAGIVDDAVDSIDEFAEIPPEPSLVEQGKPFDGRCEVKISEDKMSAFIDLYPSQYGGRPLTSGFVMGKLKSAGVVYGVNEELVKKLVRDIEQTKDVKRGVIIARGRLPEAGIDGSIEYHFSEDDSVLQK